MSRAGTIRNFQASATPQHNGTVPLNNDVPLKKDERIVPPAIEPREGEGWYAITVAPRGERRVLMAFSDEKMVAYSPMETLWIESVRLKLKVKRETQKPILPGYVFLCVEDGSRVWYDLKQRHRDGANVFGIGGIVMNDGQPCRIPTPILKQLADEERIGWFDERRRRHLEIEQNPDLGGPSLRAGERLRIVGGAFSSWEGRAEVDSANGCVRALLEIFGRETMTVVPLDHVENLDRDVASDPGNKPLARAKPISGLAQSQHSGPVDWRVLEERRLRRINKGAAQQREAYDLESMKREG